MFSKPVLTNEVIDVSKNEVINTLNYKCYFKNNVCLNKLKLPELKKIAKFHKLLVSGKKAIVIERIENRFLRDKNAGFIQNECKRYIKKRLLNIVKLNDDISECVNDTDFYTLEPLDSIEDELFFSYQDDSGIKYGFNIISLLLLIKNSKKVSRYSMDLKLLNILLSNSELVDIKNPYNRIKVNNNVIILILKRILLLNIVYPKYLSDIIVANSVNNVTRINRPNGNIQESLNRIASRYFNNSDRNNIVLEAQERLNRLRGENRTLDERVETLFMEIDGLGNYTQSSWFNRLTREDYIRLYRYLYEIWFYRGQISQELRRRICVLEDPFSRDTANFMSGHYRNNVFTMKQLCLKVFEYMVYTGIDDEHRKIGALHALRALTIVSRDARISMPYLYESL
tara:strand:- start:32 stop:1225 length:1194 start_codon:yes stop_codon:yes gene_type:complete